MFDVGRKHPVFRETRDPTPNPLERKAAADARLKRPVEVDALRRAQQFDRQDALDV